MEKDEQNKQDCPLCQVSDETLDRLEKKDKEIESSEKKSIKKKSGFFKKLFKK